MAKAIQAGGGISARFRGDVIPPTHRLTPPGRLQPNLNSNRANQILLQTIETETNHT